MVVDASIVAAAIIDPLGAAMRAMIGAISLEAPEHLVLEVAAAVRNRTLRGEMTLDEATEALRRLQRLPILCHPLVALVDRVWELRDNLTPYDAAYVALAERLRTALLTADAAIASAPGVRCRVELVRL
ncbi:MAG TPA: type II toxin-antitoxin system VapC family toxin [Candidatus Dormibacteraeota bacterium]|nr:type II toxin-antitoxin system VapC family toxin [Candidatus Dormibacteraeota bacterium]